MLHAFRPRQSHHPRRDGSCDFCRPFTLEHSTYRVFLQGGRTIDSSGFINYWQPIGSLGATFEKANNSFVSVDIPPRRDVSAVYALLQKREDVGGQC
ncbi:MAG: hypothetical protein DMG81_04960 [Acidobacteria bacterium]|nr:MAG: hypothetical protein DMG81_04960 [Acidobacteriota bacterium]